MIEILEEKVKNIKRKKKHTCMQSLLITCGVTGKSFMIATYEAKKDEKRNRFDQNCKVRQQFPIMTL